MATNKEYNDYMVATLGTVNKHDTGYCNDELVRGIDGSDTADKSVGGMVVVGIIEVVAILILSQTTDIDKTFLLMLAFYSIVKNIVLGCLFSHICTQNLGCKREWTDDKKKIAIVKICLAKMGKLKSDVNLEDFELRDRY